MLVEILGHTLKHSVLQSTLYKGPHSYNLQVIRTIVRGAKRVEVLKVTLGIVEINSRILGGISVGFVSIV
jgi:hypothetical protein